MTDPDQHYQLKPRRKAEFYSPPNHLKNKVGNGGLSEEILNKAQALLENNTIDFRPLGEMYLESLTRAIDAAKSRTSDKSDEELITALLFPIMQLKANGGMFHYELITQIADRLIQFLEVIEKVDDDAIEIMQAFQTTIRAILLGQIKGDGGSRGEELLKALIGACYRYLDKFPNNKKN